MRLSEDELNDIRLHYPSDSEDEWTVAEIAEWIGCCWQTVVNNAIKMGLKKEGIVQNEESLKRKTELERAWMDSHRDILHVKGKLRYQKTKEKLLLERRNKYRENAEYRERKKKDSRNQYTRKKQNKQS